MKNDKELFIDDKPRDLSIYEKYTDEELDKLIEESNKRAKGEISED